MSPCAALAAIISLSFHLSQDQLSVVQFFWAVGFHIFVSSLSYFLTCLKLVVPGSVIRICLRPATLQHFSWFNQLKGYLVLDE
ncbi:hypothetical protein C8J56DRAFT_1056159 [Mycena floridula]|nr:hypothetical protein C8J56DRAFT_1056159 [Mycena floridula]